jgi:hypothetical protein
MAAVIPAVAAAAAVDEGGEKILSQFETILKSYNKTKRQNESKKFLYCNGYIAHLFYSKFWRTGAGKRRGDQWRNMGDP